MNIKRWNGKIIVVPYFKKGGANNMENVTTKNDNIMMLRNKLKGNIHNAVRLAKQSAKYSKDGCVVLTSDDEWREENEWNRAWDKEES